MLCLWREQQPLAQNMRLLQQRVTDLDDPRKPTLLLNSTILATISLSMLGKMESAMNSMSLLVSWSTKT